MGLASREIEQAGISTICLSMIPALTAAAGQAAVLRATLDALASAKEYGTVIELPFLWPESRAKAMRPLPEDPSIAALCKKKPWLFLKLLNGEIPVTEAA